MPRKKIAVIGAGFSGLAVAWHLAVREFEVVIYDSKGIGGGASGIAAGLLHPFAGAHAKLNWQGREGWQATCKLLEVARQALQEEVADFSGLIRLAITPAQKEDYKKSALTHEDIEWLSKEAVQALISPYDMQASEGIFIKNAATVFSTKYLQGLWLASQSLGASFEKKHINNLKELSHFDQVVIATGAQTHQFSELQTLPITPVKGQILEWSWPADKIIPHISINSHAYITKEGEDRHWIAGATYERQFTSDSPDIQFAITDMMPKLQAFIPWIDSSYIKGCRSGIRASTPDHHPILKRLDSKTWILTGMGSKGLLYHSLFAEQLAKQI